MHVIGNYIRIIGKTPIWSMGKPSVIDMVPGSRHWYGELYAEGSLGGGYSRNTAVRKEVGGVGQRRKLTYHEIQVRLSPSYGKVLKLDCAFIAIPN